MMKIIKRILHILVWIWTLFCITSLYEMKQEKNYHPENYPKKIFVYSKIIKILILAVIALSTISFLSVKISAKKTPTCDSFRSQEEAQKFYEGDPDRYKSLNKNSKVNNLACESHKYTKHESTE